MSCLPTYLPYLQEEEERVEFALNRQKGLFPKDLKKQYQVDVILINHSSYVHSTSNWESLPAVTFLCQHSKPESGWSIHPLHRNRVRHVTIGNKHFASVILLNKLVNAYLWQTTRFGNLFIFKQPLYIHLELGRQVWLAQVIL